MLVKKIAFENVSKNSVGTSAKIGPLKNKWYENAAPSCCKNRRPRKSVLNFSSQNTVGNPSQNTSKKLLH